MSANKYESRIGIIVAAIGTPVAIAIILLYSWRLRTAFPDDAATLTVFVGKLASLEPEEQHELAVELSRYMPDEFLFPGEYHGDGRLNFRHFIAECYERGLHDLIRTLMTDSAISPAHYSQMAQLLAENGDSDALEVLLRNARAESLRADSRPDTKPGRSDRTWPGLDYSEASALALGAYLEKGVHRERVEAELISLLRSHASASVRGFAATSLHYATGNAASEALREALTDNQPLAPFPDMRVSDCARLALTRGWLR